jgi:hypothetical protein
VLLSLLLLLSAAVLLAVEVLSPALSAAAAFHKEHNITVHLNMQIRSKHVLRKAESVNQYGTSMLKRQLLKQYGGSYYYHSRNQAVSQRAIMPAMY